MGEALPTTVLICLYFMMESRAVTNDRYCIAVYSIEFLVMIELIEGGSSVPLFFIVKRFCKDLLNLVRRNFEPTAQGP